jgi:hypothetical protein
VAGQILSRSNMVDVLGVTGKVYSGFLGLKKKEYTATRRAIGLACGTWAWAGWRKRRRAEAQWRQALAEQPRYLPAFIGLGDLFVEQS